ncbi:MAG: hypothetical protein ACI9OT_001985, partial [Gammaproteobacteria bacterium]
MKHILSTFTIGALLLSCGGSKSTVNDLATANPISTSINLSSVVEDRAPVIINPGRFVTETVTYRL